MIEEVLAPLKQRIFDLEDDLRSQFEKPITLEDANQTWSAIV